MILRKHHVVKTILLIVGLIALSCVAPNASAQEEATSEGVAHIRVLSVIPETVVQVELADQVVEKQLVPGAPSAYFEVPAGRPRIKLTNSKDKKKLYNHVRSIKPDTFNTVVLYVKDGKSTIAIRNESASKITEGKARLFFYNYSSVSDDLRITVASKRAKAGYSQWLKGVPQNSSRTKSASKGNFTLQLRNGEELLKEFPDFKVNAGDRSSVFILGAADNLSIVVAPVSAE